MNVRAFLAVPVSGEVVANATRLIEKLSEKLPDSGIRWVEPDNLHITLKFFGDIRVEATHEISRAVQKVADQWEPFEIVVNGAGAFPDIQRPRTIWLGVSEGEPTFVEFAEQIEDRLHDLGYPPERRRFHPHLTIGRVKGKQSTEKLTELLSELKESYIGPSSVDEVILFDSQNEKGGPVHSRVATIEF